MGWLWVFLEISTESVVGIGLAHRIDERVDWELEEIFGTLVERLFSGAISRRDGRSRRWYSILDSFL